MRKLLIATLVLLVGTAMAATAGSDHYGGQKTLRANSMFDINVSPKPALYKAPDPGDAKLLPRGFAGAPPQIPHNTAGMSVDLANNDCAGCHEPGEPADGVVPVSETHVENGKISKARYVCQLCHVPQADAEPLVKNENDMFTQPVK